MIFNNQKVFKNEVGAICSLTDKHLHFQKRKMCRKPVKSAPTPINIFTLKNLILKSSEKHFYFSGKLVCVLNIYLKHKLCLQFLLTLNFLYEPEDSEHCLERPQTN